MTLFEDRPWNLLQEVLALTFQLLSLFPVGVRLIKKLAGVIGSPPGSGSRLFNGTSPVDKSSRLDCPIIEGQDMKTNQVPIIAACAGLVMLLPTQPPVPVHAKSSFAGVWEGKMNDLPGIDLKIEEVRGKISGHIIFYYQERSDPNGPWRTKGEYPATLLAPHVEGKTLTFEAQHHKCHECAELGPNAKFRMELVGPNEARLWNLLNEERGEDPGPGMKLVRRSEAASGPN